MEPIPGVEVEPPRCEFRDLRPVRVSEHDEVDVLVSGQHLAGVLRKERSPGRFVPGPSRLGPPRPAREPGEGEPEIGVDPPEESASQPAAGSPAQNPVAPVRGAESIPVRDVRTPPSDASPRRLGEDLDADFIAEETPPPRVVVSAHEQDPHATFHEPPQAGEHVELTARDHLTVFEPEVEQVAVDEKLVAPAVRLLEEGEKRARVFLGHGAEVDVGHDDGAFGHGPKLGARGAARQTCRRHHSRSTPGASAEHIGRVKDANGVGTTEVRVRYAETDQMGRAHHRHYLVWCELGRTALMRERGVSYAELERGGLWLPVSRVEVEYRIPVEYDELIRIHTGVERVRSREVVFAYRIARASDDATLARARTALVCTDARGRPHRFPAAVRRQLETLPTVVAPHSAA